MLATFCIVYWAKHPPPPHPTLQETWKESKWAKHSRFLCLCNNHPFCPDLLAAQLSVLSDHLHLFIDNWPNLKCFSQVKFLVLSQWKAGGRISAASEAPLPKSSGHPEYSLWTHTDTVCCGAGGKASFLSQPLLGLWLFIHSILQQAGGIHS